MSLGMPDFQEKKPRNRGNFLTKEGSMVGRLKNLINSEIILSACNVGAPSPYILNPNISKWHFAARGSLWMALSLSRRLFPYGLVLDTAPQILVSPESRQSAWTFSEFRNVKLERNADDFGREFFGRSASYAAPIGAFFCPEILAFTGDSSTVSKARSDRKVLFEQKNGPVNSR